MNFISPSMLAALAGLAVPIALHLLRRDSGTRAEVGTLRFLENLPTPRRKWSVPQDWLLLLLRCVAAALLAFLFARPLLEGERPERLVVIDRSASVAGDGVLAVARRAASADGSENTLLLDLGSELRPADPTATSAGRADFSRLAEWARGHFEGRDARNAELLVHSDLQESNLPVTKPRWPEGLKVTLIPHLHPVTTNIAVTRVRLLDWNSKTGMAKVEANWKTFGPLPDREISLSFQASDLLGTTATARPPVLVSAQLSAGTAQVELECGTTPMAAFEARITDAADPWSFDDARGSIARLYRARVAIVEADVPVSGADPCASYFLAKALVTEVGDEKAFSVKRFNTLPPGLDGFQLVALCNPRDLTAGQLQQLRSFVEKGGGLLLCAGQTTAALLPTQLASAGLLPVNFTPAPTALRVVARWDPAVLGDVMEGADPTDLTVLSRFGTEKTADAVVLAESADGAPLIAAKVVGAGRVVAANFAPDRNAAEFPLNPFYVPIMRRLASHAAGEADLSLGEDELENGPGRVARIKGRLLYLNPPAAESDPRFATVEEFSEKLGLDLAAQQTPAVGAAGTEIWPWLALGLLAALFIESLIIVLRKPCVA
jgi:hypothetical protein